MHEALAKVKLDTVIALKKLNGSVMVDKEEKACFLLQIHFSGNTYFLIRDPI